MWEDELRTLKHAHHVHAQAVVVEDAIKRYEETDTAEFRKRALAIYKDALAATEPSERADALNRLGKLLRDGVEADKAQRALTHALTEFGKRWEAAKHLDLQEKHTITQRQAEALIGGIMSIAAQFGEIGDELLKRLDRDVFRRNGIRIAG